MFQVFLFVSLCLGIVLVTLNTDYQSSGISFVVGMIIGVICKLIANYISPLFIKLKKQKTVK